jgi:asparagine synthase (glutamine-hydrolysing)
LVEDLKEMINELLSEKVVEKRGLFRYSAVKRLIDDNVSGREDNNLRIWALLNLEIWQRTFMDGFKPGGGT